ncbi:hypothetical protein E4U59_005342 [Claviceps monticola]|nr:hypothetical protein E4U59_005342 [Claviceps monticola]
MPSDDLRIGDLLSFEEQQPTGCRGGGNDITQSKFTIFSLKCQWLIVGGVAGSHRGLGDNAVKPEGGPSPT